MAVESNKTEETGKKLDSISEKKDSGVTLKKKQRGFLSRIWNGLFRRRDDDFEKRLQRIAKEENAVVARMERRSQSRKRMTRHLIIFSVFFEVIAVGYAIMTTRSIDLNWKTRAFRVLPMFLLPALSSFAYTGLVSFSRMRNRNDQKTLERLRAERQAEVDELKEKRNFYRTQQLIQRYDTDPAAKAAAATVLASKLGADSGLKLYVGDESSLHGTAKSSDTERTQSSGLRNRKQSHPKSASIGSTVVEQSGEHMPENCESAGPGNFTNNNQLVVVHHQPGLNANGGGWIARFAALLVGEDPTQSYALICGNCHMHNGLSRKEDFPNITYYCPHCNALNKSQPSDGGPDSDPVNVISSTSLSISDPIKSDSDRTSERVSSSSSLTVASVETEEIETVLPGDSKSVS